MISVSIVALPEGKLPARQTAGSAGYDVFSRVSVDIPAGEQRMIPLGFKVALPEGYHAKIEPRSGLANNFGIDTLAGVIDSDYRGEVCAILINHGKVHALSVRPGDRIAQLVLHRTIVADWLPAASVEEFGKEHMTTQRGSGGFGSTGGFCTGGV